MFAVLLRATSQSILCDRTFFNYRIEAVHKPTKAMYTFSLLAAIAGLASAQDIAFIYPPSKGATISLYRNERININWTTTFDRNTLTVFQGPDKDGSYAFQNLQSESAVRGIGGAA